MMGIMAVAIVLLTLAVGALGYKVLTLDERTVEVQRVIREVAPADNYLLEREEWVSEQELERRLKSLEASVCRARGGSWVGYSGYCEGVLDRY